MKLSFDVYTRNLENATEAYMKLDAVCKEIRIGKGKRWSRSTSVAGVQQRSVSDDAVDDVTRLGDSVPVDEAVADAD